MHLSTHIGTLQDPNNKKDPRLTCRETWLKYPPAVKYPVNVWRTQLWGSPCGYMFLGELVGLRKRVLVWVGGAQLIIIGLGKLCGEEHLPLGYRGHVGASRRAL